MRLTTDLPYDQALAEAEHLDAEAERRSDRLWRDVGIPVGAGSLDVPPPAPAAFACTPCECGGICPECDPEDVPW